MEQVPDLPNRLPGETGISGASRGCKHLCRHCSVVPVYNGRFRIVQAEVVLEDIRRQVAAGAQHITFGDPDLLNGPGHALRLVEALQAEFPRLTKLDKGHTREDFIAVVEDCRAAGLALAPTFVPFTPWTTRAGFRDLLRPTRSNRPCARPTKRWNFRSLPHCR